jgi:hypothetical protein
MGWKMATTEVMNLLMKTEIPVFTGNISLIVHPIANPFTDRLFRMAERWGWGFHMKAKG